MSSTVKQQNFSKITGFLQLAALAFAVNFLWEHLQAPLYSCYADFWTCVWLCFRASLGDVVIVLALYGLYRWKPSRLLTILVGILIAIGIEWHALATDRWSYADSMPLLPFLNVGLTPILQMAILPLAIFSLNENWKKLPKFLLTLLLLGLGALFFLTEALLHVFGLPILEHDRIFLFTHDRYIALFALTYAFLLILTATNPKKYHLLGWTAFIGIALGMLNAAFIGIALGMLNAAFIGIALGMLNAAFIAAQGGYEVLFHTLTLDQDLSVLGLWFGLWYLSAVLAFSTRK